MSLPPKEEKNTDIKIPKEEKESKPLLVPKSSIGAQIALLLLPAIQAKMSRKQIKWSTATATVIPEFHLIIFNTLETLTLTEANIRAYFADWPICKIFASDSIGKVELPMYISYNEEKYQTKCYFTWAVYNDKGRKVRPLHFAQPKPKEKPDW